MKLRTPITLLLIVVLTLSTITAQSRDDAWRSVRTNHLFVIGNADPASLWKVAVWLEFFHSAFARLVSRNVIDSSVPTTVIVFRDDAWFTPFKPGYQGRPAPVSGFFLSGDDVNYIALSLDPRQDPYATAFHEYVHLHVKDNIPGAPVWLNEGLAELYESLQFSGNDAVIGVPKQGYIYLLRQVEMLPLKTLFSVGTNSPHYNERDKAGIFYGESWALVHYLMLGDRARQNQFKTFLQRVANGDDAAKAIESVYGITLDVLEEELRAYVRRGNLTAQVVTGVANAESYRSYTATQRSTLTEAEVDYYLSDLSLHMGRDNVAERGFKEAIAQDPGFIPAYVALGKMYVEQRRYAEALEMAQKAHQLSPGNAKYAALVDDIKQYGAGSTTTRDRREPARTTTSRMLGGDSGPVVINDGQTVDSSGALPSVDDVVNKYIQAIGGAAAVNAVTSRVVKGTLDVVGVSRGGTFESYTVAPNKALSIIQPTPTETIRAGYNGQIGWMQTGTSIRLLKAAELEATKNDADFYGILNPKRNYARLTLVGKSKIGYREVYVIDMQPATGSVDRLFLDAESYLPVRMNTVRLYKGASVPVEIYYDDWREAGGGLKLPHVLTHSFQKRTMTLTVKDIKNNVPIDPKIFEKP